MTRRSGPGSEPGPERSFPARVLAPGRASAAAVVLSEPLSLWGGMDPATGAVVDRRHPQAGASLRGAVVVMPYGRGSSSTSSVLAEAIRAGTAPAALVLEEPDSILALGALVGRELYGREVPVVALPGATATVATGDVVTVETSGAPGVARVRVAPGEAVSARRRVPPVGGRSRART